MTSGKWCFLAIWLGALPATIIGYYCGIQSASMASQPAWWLWCGIPAALMAFALPHSGPVLAIAFGLGFHSGFHALESICEEIRDSVNLLFGILTGQPVVFQHPIKYFSDPLWIYMVIIVAACFCAALRLKVLPSFLSLMQLLQQKMNEPD